MKRIAISSVALLAPVLALAAETLDNVVGTVGNIIGALTPLVVALALLFFFWGLAKYILAAGDESKQAEGRSIMIWGVVALFVMVSVWGLVQVLQQTFLGTTSPEGTGTPPSGNINI